MERVTVKERRNRHDEERLVQMLKALGNPVRFQIMQTLAERQGASRRRSSRRRRWRSRRSASI